MRFELTPEIIDQVIFAMENQESPFLFDSETRTVVEVREEGEDEAAEGRYIEIPEWSSADGFQLMERFVASLRNPLVRDKLRTALSSGKGVFRSFKNALKAHGEIERLWFAYKDREMKARVLDWYNELCDLWGWEHIRREPGENEETDELVLTDFDFIEETDSEVAQAYDREAWRESHSFLPAALVEELYKRSRHGVDTSPEASLVISARTPAGELSGVIWGVVTQLRVPAEAGTEELKLLNVIQLYVLKEYRGLGIAKTLVDNVCRAAYARGIERILMELPGAAEMLLPMLEEQGFSTASRSLMLDVDKWGRDTLEE